MGGLLAYLAGPGRSNEHTEPHLVAGDSAIMAWHDDAELHRESALQIAWQLDQSRRVFDVTVPRGSVWHCALSLHRDEGMLPDEQWASISEQFVSAMGFADTTGGPPCRWVAVRHGVSAAGNDHVHVVVSLVHEDGTKANVWNDRPRAQRAVAAIEREHGLQVIVSRDVGRGGRGHTPAEHALAQRRAQPELARDTLARVVRASATAAADEAEFVRRVRRAGVRIRPRYAAGRGDVVAGYSVALRPPEAEAPIWYGGGHLARDLSLPRLRDEWPDSPEQAGAAVAEWAAAKRNQRPAASGREAHEPDPELWRQYTADVAQLRERLHEVPVDDHATWAHVARETAGAFAAWSLRVEETPGPLAATADVLARSAELRARPVRARHAALPSARGAALLLASAARGGRGPVAEAVLLRQLANTAKALHDAHQAAGDARRAEAIAHTVRTQLAAVSARLPALDETGSAIAVDDAQATEAARLAARGQSAPRPPGSPVPTPLGEPRPAVRPAPATKDSEVQR